MAASTSSATLQKPRITEGESAWRRRGSKRRRASATGRGASPGGFGPAAEGFGVDAGGDGFRDEIDAFAEVAIRASSRTACSRSWTWRASAGCNSQSARVFSPMRVRAWFNH
jgi:hypothetical protein